MLGTYLPRLQLISGCGRPVCVKEPKTPSMSKPLARYHRQFKQGIVKCPMYVSDLEK